MKLLVLLTLVGFCTCQAAVSAQNSKITLSATNTTLASVFRQIEQLTDYMFIYKSGDIAPFTDITIDRRQTEVNRILDECLSGTGLSYTFKDNLIIIQGATQQAEEKKVNGKITDRQGHPLPGVTVMIKGQRKIHYCLARRKGYLFAFHLYRHETARNSLHRTKRNQCDPARGSYRDG